VTDALRKRVLTAVVLGAVLFAIVLWLPKEATVGVVTLLVLAGAWEWSAFLLLGTPALRTAYVLLVAAMLLGAWHVSATPEGRDLLLSVAVLWWLTALLWIAFAPRRVAPWSAAAAGVLGVGGHLDGGGHPGELAGLGDDGVVGAEGEFEDGHRRAEDAILHEFSPGVRSDPPTLPKVRKVFQRDTLSLYFNALPNKNRSGTGWRAGHLFGF